MLLVLLLDSWLVLQWSPTCSVIGQGIVVITLVDVLPQQLWQWKFSVSASQHCLSQTCFLHHHADESHCCVTVDHTAWLCWQSVPCKILQRYQLTQPLCSPRHIPSQPRRNQPCHGLSIAHRISRTGAGRRWWLGS